MRSEEVGVRSSGANASISLRRLVDCCGLPSAGNIHFRGEAAATIEKISEPKAKSFFHNSSLLTPTSYLHPYRVSIISINRSNKNPVSFGPEQASGWNCTVRQLRPG